MTTEPKCLPACRVKDEFLGISEDTHAPGCPNAEAPKVKHDGWSCGCMTKIACELAEDAQSKPAPAPKPKSNHMEEPLNMVDKNNSFQVDRKFYPVTCAQLSGSELLDMADGEGEREIWLRGVGAPDYKLGLGEFVEVRRGMRFYSAPKYINNSAPAPKGSEEPMRLETRAPRWSEAVNRAEAHRKQENPR